MAKGDLFSAVVRKPMTNGRAARGAPARLNGTPGESGYTAASIEVLEGLGYSRPLGKQTGTD